MRTAAPRLPFPGTSVRVAGVSLSLFLLDLKIRNSKLEIGNWKLEIQFLLLADLSPAGVLQHLQHSRLKRLYKRPHESRAAPFHGLHQQIKNAIHEFVGLPLF